MTSQPKKLTARLGIALAAVALAVSMSSCGTTTDDDHGGQGHGTSAEADGPHNAADLTFAEQMIPHHQQAIELVDLLPGRTANAEVVELAGKIRDAQQPEITTMTGWIEQWQPKDGGTTTEHHGSGHQPGMAGMAGMVDNATMTKLKAASGPEFDKLWLTAMIAHHEGAIEMARTELSGGQNEQAKELAQQIIDGQQAEITQMKTMLGNA